MYSQKGEISKNVDNWCTSNYINIITSPKLKLKN